MKIIIERFSGNRVVTKGRLSIEGTPFACYTLEAANPQYAKTRNMEMLALPEGRYTMKLVHNPLFCTLRFALFGTYHNAQFDSGTEPDDVASGSVILGTEFDGEFAIKGSDKAMNLLAKFLQIQVLERKVLKNEQEYITATITHAPDFTYNKSAFFQSTPLKFDDYDWNLIDEETDVEPQ